MIKEKTNGGSIFIANVMPQNQGYVPLYDRKTTIPDFAMAMELPNFKMPLEEIRLSHRLDFQPIPSTSFFFYNTDFSHTRKVK